MRPLTDDEFTFLDNLMSASGQAPASLVELFAIERKQRAPRIPQDWREQASEFLAEKGAYKLVPGIAGGRMIRERKPGFTVSIDDVDTLLMLVGDPSDMVPEN